MQIDGGTVAIVIAAVSLVTNIVTIVRAFEKMNSRHDVQDIKIQAIQNLIATLATRENVSLRLDNQSGMLKNLQEENLRIWSAIEQLRVGDGYIKARG